MVAAPVDVVTVVVEEVLDVVVDGDGPVASPRPHAAATARAITTSRRTRKGVPRQAMPTGSLTRMAHSSDRALVVLHTVRLKGFADAAPVAASTGLPVDEVQTELEQARDKGLVTRREGRISGWSLTAEGRAEVGRLVAAELEAAGARVAVQEAYRRFLAVNKDLLGVCTDWQLRVVEGQQVPNDHADAGYDESVVKRLRVIDDAVQPVCDELAAALDRFRRYGPRLSIALTRVEAGELDWFTKPLIDSYHTVWFELHEDLLATLGIERGSET